ncbi:MAG: DUF3179 domain-containing protein, partial [Spirochaetales bacterium]|nr:DUF3179 domain-containing protein [Spirochaetales bacterium]
MSYKGSIAYSHRIYGEAAAFGTTGKLYNSNLVMYDRKTDTYWSQIDGRAIYGKLKGEQLKLLPVDTVIWGNWKKYHNNFTVLDRNTGYSRVYGNDPYGSYYTADTLFFLVEKESDALHPKAVIYGIEVDGIYKAFCVYIQNTFKRYGRSVPMWLILLLGKCSGCYCPAKRNRHGIL